jgi:hypothetical protein
MHASAPPSGFRTPIGRRGLGEARGEVRTIGREASGRRAESARGRIRSEPMPRRPRIRQATSVCLTAQRWHRSNAGQVRVSKTAPAHGKGQRAARACSLQLHAAPARPATYRYTTTRRGVSPTVSRSARQSVRARGVRPSPPNKMLSVIPHVRNRFFYTRRDEPGTATAKREIRATLNRSS